jgi:hypothetical protein
MTLDENLRFRCEFLLRVVNKELNHLSYSDQKVFSQGLPLEAVQQLDDDQSLAESIEAFVGRYGRLQDTLGNKLLPLLLLIKQEELGPVADNLDKAERFGWIPSADQWFEARQLRNKMVHDYIEELEILHDSLLQGHVMVTMLESVAQTLCDEISKTL